MNNVAIIGRLTATPELKYTPNGKAVCSFCVAVERKFKDSNKNTITDYVDIVAWNSQAEFLCKWFDKGIRVGITGEIHTRLYEKDGQSHKVVEVLANTIEFADGKREANVIATDTNTFTAENSDGDFIPTEVIDDDLPFEL